MGYWRGPGGWGCPEADPGGNERDAERWFPLTTTVAGIGIMNAKISAAGKSLMARVRRSW